MYCFEQILEATPHKTAAVRPHTFYLTDNQEHAEQRWRNIDELISDVLL